MTSRPLWLSLIFGLAYLLVGLSELLRLGPRFLPSSWVTIYAALPGWAWWIWPGLFVLTGAVAATGRRVPRMAWLGYRMASAMFGLWGLVGIWGWSHGGAGNIPGSTTMFVLALSLWVLADYVSLGEAAGRIDEKVAALAEKVEAVSNGG